jgi:hypothetical protein
LWSQTVAVSEGLWSEADDKAERREAISLARAEALAREDAVSDLPSVLRLASRAVDNLVRSTLNARRAACRSRAGREDGRLADLVEALARVADVDRGRHQWNRW